MAETGTDVSTDGISRRAFVGRTVVAGMGIATIGVVKTAETASAQTTGEAPSAPVLWKLVEESTGWAVSFARMPVMTLGRKDPPPEPGSPSRFILPTVHLEDSPNIKRLRDWHRKAIAEGPGNAAKMARLRGFDENGTLIERYRLHDVFPAQLTVTGLETSAQGTRVAEAVFACLRVEKL